MRKSLVGTSECKGSLVRYYLLVEDTVNDLETYGIAVEYQDEEDLFSDLTLSGREILSLLDIMMKGSVTPTTARDVIEDWLLF